MSIRRDDSGMILLVGSCPVEDADLLLQMLQATPAAPVDWTQCTHLHTAVVQVILAARPALVGECGEPWLREWLGASLASL